MRSSEIYFILLQFNFIRLSETFATCYFARQLDKLIYSRFDQVCYCPAKSRLKCSLDNKGFHPTF